MIQIIHGENGTGKTKQIIAMANNIASGIKGSSVFVDNENSYMYDLDYSIRFVNIADYFKPCSMASFIGFLAGLCASDSDLEYVFVDSFLKIVKNSVSDMESFFSELDTFATSHNLHIVLSMNESKEQFPEYLAKYLAD